MVDTKTPGDKKLSVPSKTLTLKPRVETGTVRQSFSHGRSKQVVVEKRGKRRIGDTGPEPQAPEVAAKPAPAPAAAPRPAEPPDARLLQVTRSLLAGRFEVVPAGSAVGPMGATADPVASAPPTENLPHGDSFTMGWGVARAEDAFPQRVAARLDQVRSGGFDVLNLAEVGSSVGIETLACRANLSSASLALPPQRPSTEPGSQPTRLSSLCSARVRTCGSGPACAP